jgi:RNA polymerase sigma factor (sigma-70 family)
MTTRTLHPLNSLVRTVRRAALLRDPTFLSDARLLESFLASRDEAAFELLVKRHGPMVLGVCVRVIGNLHDAEDAFQAVFLVLARKAASIVPRELVGNWLYGVAYRTALQARERLGRHRARERQVNEMPQPTVAADVDLEELHQALDRELNHLPEKFRVPIVLCDLEGRSRKDVAVQLKIPEGTLSSRLAKGRELLASRLARHGLVLSGAALATMLAHQSASAMQPVLVATTIKAAVLAAAGQSAAGLASAEAVALSHGVMKTMFLSKLKVISILVLGLVLGAVGAGFIGLPGDANAPVVHAAQIGLAGAKEEDPLDGSYLLDEQIHKELRLSKNQVQQLRAIAEQADTKNKAKREEIAQIQKQIDELQKRIVSLQDGINADRSKSVGKAAPDILSNQAVTRLRQIQRQARSLDQMLEDPKVRRMLKVDDEQVKKIETILKTEPRHAIATYERVFGDRVLLGATNDGTIRFWDSNTGAATLGGLYTSGVYAMTPNHATLRKLFDVLTPTQQKTLLEWVGEPYQSNSWKVLRGK